MYKRNSVLSSGQDPLKLPYRLCLSGGWLDQAWVSNVCNGSVVVVCLEPLKEYNRRSGMATSTRNTARLLWEDVIPKYDDEEIAKLLFGAENPPGSAYISGSQDSIGLVYTGFSKIHYNGHYWPDSIENIKCEEIAKWFQKNVHMLPIIERPEGYDPIKIKNLMVETVQELASASEKCWDAIVNMDINALAESFNATRNAWKSMLPETVPKYLEEYMAYFKDLGVGYTFSGCGGGYLLFVSDGEVPNEVPFRVKL